MLSHSVMKALNGRIIEEVKWLNFTAIELDGRTARSYTCFRNFMLSNMRLLLSNSLKFPVTIFSRAVAIEEARKNPCFWVNTFDFRFYFRKFIRYLHIICIQNVRFLNPNTWISIQ